MDKYNLFISLFNLQKLNLLVTGIFYKRRYIKLFFKKLTVSIIVIFIMILDMAINNIILVHIQRRPIEVAYPRQRRTGYQA